MVKKYNTRKKKQSGGIDDDQLKILKERLKSEENILSTLQSKMLETQNEAKEALNNTITPELGTFYNIFSSFLIIISYILFGIASAIFINTCIHFNKASIEDIVNNSTVNDKRKLIDQPIFGYLKSINYLSTDKFILYFDGINTPFSWVFFSIISVSLICIICQIIIWLIKEKEKFQILKNELSNTQFITKLIPYIYLIIISSIFNDNQKRFESRLTINMKINGIEYKGSEVYKPSLIDSNLLKELKKIIIYCINTDKEYDDKYIKGLLNGVNIVLYTDLMTKTTIILDIFTIYDACYNINKLPGYKGLANDEKKKIEEEYKFEKIKFINYIDEYFNILINDKSTDVNYYAKYYLLGLIKNNPNPSSTSNITRLIEYRKKLSTELIMIKDEIYRYYISVIVFYVLFLIIIMMFHFFFILNTISEVLFIYKIGYVGVITTFIIIMGIYIGMFKSKF